MHAVDSACSTLPAYYTQAGLCTGMHASAKDSTPGSVPCAVQHIAEQTIIVLLYQTPL